MPLPMTSAASARVASCARALAVAATLALFAAWYAMPVEDIDFWWHIAAGRFIVEHGRLPETDPFGVYGTGNPIRNATVLQGQWLGQVALYAVHEALGPGGVAALRAALLGACLLVVHARARLVGGGAFWSLALTALAGIGLPGFLGERPQLFSFACAGLVLLLVDWRLCGGPRWAVLAVPVLGVLWVNLHGGVILGLAVLAAHSGVEALRAARGSAGSTRWRELVLLTVAFFGATLLGPNGITSYLYIAQTHASQLERLTSEYASALRIYPLAGWMPQAWVYAYFAVTALALPGLVRRASAQAAVVVLLAVASATAYRYHAFFLLLAAPYAAAGLERLAARRQPWFARTGAVAAVAAVPILSAVALLGLAPRPLLALARPVATEHVPAAAVEHLRSVSRPARVLAWFNWGGYLLWKLEGSVRPYVDGRMLDDAPLAPYTHMLWATPEGLAWFDAADFDLVLLPWRGLSGDVYPLHAALAQRPDWVVRFRWDGGVLYARAAR